MKLVYSFNINNDNNILDLCKISKNLYNQALYEINTNLKDNKFLFYNDLNKIMISKFNLENQINYKLLKAQISQQILMLLDKNIKSYYKSIKDYKINPHKYKGKPKLPKYKKKYNLLIYTNQCSQIKNSYIILSKDLKICIPQWNKYKNSIKSYNQIRIIPKLNYIKIEIVYNKDIENNNLDYNNYSSIDLGINNLVTLISNNNLKPLLISGKQIKSINQYFNKQLSKLQSIKDKQKIKGLTNKIKILYEKRENIIKDLFHKISRFIINYLVKNKIGTLIIGYNKGWKDSIALGRKTNQKFVQIPYLRLIDYLKYKSELIGIKLILNEESYTSKCDGLSLEKISKHDNYSGKRIKRGLFQSNKGVLINADINGALNILRKVVGDSQTSIFEIINSGLLFNPIKIRDLFNMNNLNFLLKN